MYLLYSQVHKLMGKKKIRFLLPRLEGTHIVKETSQGWEEVFPDFSKENLWKTEFSKLKRIRKVKKKQNCQKIDRYIQSEITEYFYDMAKPYIFKRVKNTQNSIKHIML